MQNYFKYMMLTYLSKELHSFLNISVLSRKLFTDTYPIQRFFKKMTFFHTFSFIKYLIL